jgi:hypothetical protein
VLWGGGRELRRIAESGRLDIACRIERNDWNGSSSVQLVARSVTEVPELAPATGVCASACDATCGERRGTPRPEAPAAAAEQVLHDLRDRGAYAELVRLAAAGGSLLVVCADVSRRRAMLAGPLHPRRLGLDAAVLLSDRCSDEAIATRLAVADGRAVIALTDYATLPRVATAFPRVVALDPPVGPAQRAALAALGEVTLVWGAAEVRAAGRSAEAAGPRALCGAAWKALASGPASLAAIVERVAAEPHPPVVDDIAWAVDVLVQAGLVTGDGDELRRVEPDAEIDLARVPAYAARLAEHRTALAELVPEPAAVG